MPVELSPRRDARRLRGAHPEQRGNYGAVVDSVNVSVLLYVPVRSGSLAPIVCLNVSVSAEFETGAA